jgi:hypothetical protein
MNKRIKVEHFLGWCGFLMSTVFILTVTVSSMR